MEKFVGHFRKLININNSQVIIPKNEILLCWNILGEAPERSYIVKFKSIKTQVQRLKLIQH